MTIIDVHGHWGPWFFPMDIGPTEVNIRLMDEYGITVQLVSASEAVVYDAPGGNARLDPVLRSEPRLRGYVVANPNNLADTEADIRRYLSEPHWVGVKIHTGYPRRAIASPQMRDTFALLNEFDARILIHTWDTDVIALAGLLQDNPRLRAIAAHMGGARWDLATEAAQGCDRLYLEPSCSITDAGKVAHVAANVPAAQLVFGTDATLIDPAVSFGMVRDAELSPELSEAMYWRNAAELFGLTDAVFADTAQES